MMVDLLQNTELSSKLSDILSTILDESRTCNICLGFIILYRMTKNVLVGLVKFYHTRGLNKINCIGGVMVSVVDHDLKHRSCQTKHYKIGSC